MRLKEGHQSKLVYSPHTYGPSVYMQNYFKDRNFPHNMEQIWSSHFAFVQVRGHTRRTQLHTATATHGQARLHTATAVHAATHGHTRLRTATHGYTDSRRITLARNLREWP